MTDAKKLKIDTFIHRYPESGTRNKPKKKLNKSQRERIVKELWGYCKNGYARRMISSGFLNEHEQIEDLDSEAWVALNNAMDKFDVSKFKGRLSKHVNHPGRNGKKTLPWYFKNFYNNFLNLATWQPYKQRKALQYGIESPDDSIFEEDYQKDAGDMELPIESQIDKLNYLKELKQVVEKDCEFILKNGENLLPEEVNEAVIKKEGLDLYLFKEFKEKISVKNGCSENKKSELDLEEYNITEKEKLSNYQFPKQAKKEMKRISNTIDKLLLVGTLRDDFSAKAEREVLSKCESSLVRSYKAFWNPNISIDMFTKTAKRRFRLKMIEHINEMIIRKTTKR